MLESQLVTQSQKSNYTVSHRVTPSHNESENNYTESHRVRK